MNCKNQYTSWKIKINLKKKKGFTFKQNNLKYWYESYKPNVFLRNVRRQVGQQPWLSQHAHSGSPVVALQHRRVLYRTGSHPKFVSESDTGWTLIKHRSTPHRHMSRLRVPGRGMPGGVWSWWGRADWPQDGPHRGRLLPSDPGTRPEDSAALPAAESEGHVQSFQMNLTAKLQTFRNKHHEELNS